MFSFNRFAQNGAVILRTSSMPTKLGSSRTTSTVIGNLASINTLSELTPPVKTFSVPKKAPLLLQQLIGTRQYSDVERKPEESSLPVEIINKPKRVDTEETRWFHPSPTERMENPAYTYLRSHPEYQTLFFQHDVYSRLMTEDGKLTPEGEETVNPAVKSFIDLLNSNPVEYITSPKYEPIFRDLTSQSSKLTDVELLLVFYNFRRFPMKPKAKDKDYRTIWMPLDDVCYGRMNERQWTLEYMFNLADLMFSAGLATESKFHWALVKKLYRRVDHLSKEEFIRMMFCFGGVKSLPDSLSIYNCEYNLHKFIDELTPEEVSVASVGFLRTKTCVSSREVLSKMLRIVAQEADRIPSPSISAVAKAVNISSFNTNKEDVYNFLDAFVAEVPRIDIHACASMVLLGMKTRVEHERLLLEILKKMEGNVSIMRTKDLEYICDALSTFNIECEEVYREVVEVFREWVKNTELKSFCLAHGKSFINILHHLSHRNIYPNDLIALALSDKFLDITFGRSMYTYCQEVLLLDICTGLEAEGYDGPRLSDKYRGFLTKKNMLWIADDEKVTTSEYQRIARYMLEVCINSLGGPEFCHLCNVVPPFRTIGAVYCIDESTQTPVPVPEDFVSIDDFNIKYIPESGTDANVKFHAIVLFPGSHVAANTGKPIGRSVMHCRQMEKMGFRVHPVYLSHTASGPEEMKQVISEILHRSVPDEPKIK